MALPSVTHSFTASTTIESGQVNTNFNDIINSLTDGTKSLTIDALTAASATISGAFTLNGTVGSNLLPTDATYNLGGTSNGYVGLYLDNGATDGGSVYFDGSNSSYLQSSADGATLTAVGFTTLNIDGSLTVDTDATVTGEMTISGTGTHSVSAEFANEVFEEYERTVSASPGVRGVAVSSSSGSYTRNSTTFAAVTNLSVTLVTSGRPVMLKLIESITSVTPGSTSQSSMRMHASADTVRSYFYWKRDSTVVGAVEWSHGIGGGTITFREDHIHAGSMCHIDTPSAGTYTYTLEAATASTTTLSLFSVKLVAYEL